MTRRHMLAIPFLTAALHAAEQDLKARFEDLSARGIAMLQVTEDMKARLARRRLGLAPDIVAAKARMESALDEAEKQLKEGSSANAAAAMDRAESAIRKLEARFGR